jgi:hypothetical protein
VRRARLKAFLLKRSLLHPMNQTPVSISAGISTLVLIGV